MLVSMVKKKAPIYRFIITNVYIFLYMLFMTISNKKHDISMPFACILLTKAVLFFHVVFGGFLPK